MLFDKTKVRDAMHKMVAVKQDQKKLARTCLDSVRFSYYGVKVSDVKAGLQKIIDGKKMTTNQRKAVQAIYGSLPLADMAITRMQRVAARILTYLQVTPRNKDTVSLSRDMGDEVICILQYLKEGAK